MRFGPVHFTRSPCCTDTLRDRETQLRRIEQAALAALANPAVSTRTTLKAIRELSRT